MTGLENVEDRGWVSRRLLAEDSRWGKDVVLSVQGAKPALGWAAMWMLGHHFVRIIFEGERLLTSKDPRLGIPELAALLDSGYSDLTRRIRHTSKLLDDTKKHPDDILAELRMAQRESFLMFVSPVMRPMRFLAKDLGLYQVNGAVVGATVTMLFRMGIDPSTAKPLEREMLRAASEEWGGSLAVMSAADLAPDAVTFGALPVSGFDPTGKDWRVEKYLDQRFDPTLPYEEKLLLLMIEGDLNTNLHLLPLTERGHEMVVFRARTTTIYHSLTAVAAILERHPGLATAAAQRVKEVLADATTGRLLGHEGKQVRNRCVHYAIHDERIIPQPALPMFGLVEAAYPGRTWVDFNHDVLTATEGLSEALANW